MEVTIAHARRDEAVARRLAEALARYGVAAAPQARADRPARASPASEGPALAGRTLALVSAHSRRARWLAALTAGDGAPALPLLLDGEPPPAGVDLGPWLATGDHGALRPLLVALGVLPSPGRPEEWVFFARETALLLDAKRLADEAAQTMFLVDRFAEDRAVYFGPTLDAAAIALEVSWAGTRDIRKGLLESGLFNDVTAAIPILRASVAGREAPSVAHVLALLEAMLRDLAILARRPNDRAQAKLVAAEFAGSEGLDRFIRRIWATFRAAHALSLTLRAALLERWGGER